MYAQQRRRTGVMSRVGLLLAGATVVLGLNACSRPYVKPVLDPPTASFPGISSQWSQSATKVRVLFVHGICTHTAQEWISDGWDVSIKSFFPSAIMTPGPFRRVDGVEIYDHEYRIGNDTLSARYLIWSPLTSAAKATLDFDDLPSYSQAGEFTWGRAALNGQLKETLVNDCFSDAVVYAGVEGRTIQRKLTDAICAALGGTPGGAGCDFSRAKNYGNARIVIVTESLGSRMVFDAISSLQQEAARKGKASLDAFAKAVSPVAEIFMLANQLPLLALAEHVPTCAADSDAYAVTKSFSSMTSALEALAAARRQYAALQRQKKLPSLTGPITLVAFSDPNDLLTYRIPPDDSAIVGSDKVVNVIVSNANTYFGYVENPEPAHLAYYQNPAVLRLIFDGTAR